MKFALEWIFRDSRAGFVNPKLLRVDVLHPPTIVRRTVALETGIQHGHNHQRVSSMQHKLYTDYINKRKPAFYG